MSLGISLFPPRFPLFHVNSSLCLSSSSVSVSLDELVIFYFDTEWSCRPGWA